LDWQRIETGNATVVVPEDAEEEPAEEQAEPTIASCHPNWRTGGVPGRRLSLGALRRRDPDEMKTRTTSYYLYDDDEEDLDEDMDEDLDEFDEDEGRVRDEDEDI